jgi:2',3'-cyclic-nucleotide 2'-phosphodiesterase (5'-nucleotidase family)
MGALKIYYTNDMHNRTTALDALEARPDRSEALLLDSGDAIGGSNTAFRMREPILSRMTALGYRAMAMGNREFHYLRWVQRRRERERGFPLLVANLEDLRGHEPWPWQASSELVVGETRIGLLGVTPVQYPIGSVWERLTGFRFLDPATSLAPIIERLRSRVEVVILLSHLGLAADRELLARLPRLDLVLGAHSHDFTPEPERVGGSWLIHGGSHSRYLGELTLHTDPTRVTWEPHTL